MHLLKEAAEGSGGENSVLKTWHVEHGTAASLRSPTQTLGALSSSLAPSAARRPKGGGAALLADGRWYLSCVVQHDPHALANVLAALPLDGAPACLPSTSSSASGAAAGKRKRAEGGGAGPDVRCSHAEAVWVFFGQNCGEESGGMRGRPEHTDDISHSGTWHMQLSGSKVRSTARAKFLY